MSTTEVFVEQLIIGLLVLLVAGLLAFEDLLPQLFDAEVGGLAVIAGMAYLIGILFDRMADTILGRLERHHRLLFAAREAVRREASNRPDPFPEDRLRIGVLGPEGHERYAEYLRSRIRLTRALAVAAPALAVGTSVYLAGKDPVHGDLIRQIAIGVVVVAYSLTTIRRVGKSGELKRGDYKSYAEQPEASKQLRTDDMGDAGLRESYMNQAWQKEKCQSGKLIPFVWRNERDLACWALTLCALPLTGSLLAEKPFVGVLSGLGGVALTALSGWSWWRITETYFTFLHDFGKRGRVTPSTLDPAGIL